MKKIIAVIMILALLVAFGACKKSNNSSNQQTNEESTGTSSQSSSNVELTEDMVQKYIKFFPKFVVKAREVGVKFKQNETMAQAQFGNNELTDFIKSNGYASREEFYTVYSKMSKATPWIMLQGSMANVPAATRAQMESQMNQSIQGFSDAEKAVLKKHATEIRNMYMSIPR